MYALCQSIQQILLPAQVESIAPEAKVATLALLTTLSAVASMVALPFAANFYSGAVSAILPDRVAVRHRGIASAVVGLATPVGIIIGVNIASRVDQFWGYTIVAVVVLVATVALVIGAREPSSLDLPRL